MSKSAAKTVTKLAVKIGRNYVYLHAFPNAPEYSVNAMLSFGPTKGACSVYSFINNQNFDHATKRQIRKALYQIGRRDLAAYSVPSKKIATKKINARIAEYRKTREAEIREHTRGRYEQSDLHGAATI